MQGILDAIINPTFGFPEIFAAIGEFFVAFSVNPSVNALWSSILTSVGTALPYVHIVTFAFCVIVAFFGKKIFSLLRFLFFLFIGYAVGVVLVSPVLIEIMPTLPDWAVGVIIGFISAIVSKFLYFIAVAAVVGYSAYLAFFGGFLGFALGNSIVSLFISICAIVLIFILRKYIEMIITSALGAWGVATALTVWWDYTKLDILVGVEWVGILIVSVIIATLGFIVQFKMRERY